MILNFKPPFSRFVKKAHKPLHLAIEDVVDGVCADVTIGESKVGDLSGIRVYKFKFNRQEYLVAYRFSAAGEVVDPTEIEWLIIDFYQVGLHENFYDDLKRYLKTGG